MKHFGMFPLRGERVSASNNMLEIILKMKNEKKKKKKYGCILGKRHVWFVQ